MLKGKLTLQAMLDSLDVRVQSLKVNVMFSEWQKSLYLTHYTVKILEEFPG